MTDNQLSAAVVLGLGVLGILAVARAISRISATSGLCARSTAPQPSLLSPRSESSPATTSCPSAAAEGWLITVVAAEDEAE